MCIQYTHEVKIKLKIKIKLRLKLKLKPTLTTNAKLTRNRIQCDGSVASRMCMCAEYMTFLGKDD